MPPFGYKLAWVSATSLKTTKQQRRPASCRSVIGCSSVIGCRLPGGCLQSKPGLGWYHWQLTYGRLLLTTNTYDACPCGFCQERQLLPEDGSREEYLTATSGARVLAPVYTRVYVLECKGWSAKTGCKVVFNVLAEHVSNVQCSAEVDAPWEPVLGVVDLICVAPLWQAWHWTCSASVSQLNASRMHDAFSESTVGDKSLSRTCMLHLATAQLGT